MAIQRDPRSFARHLDFDPDRWCPERATNIPKHAMSPFSSGNRKCSGDHLAMAELVFILAAVVPRRRLEHVPRADLSPRIGITLRPKRLPEPWQPAAGQPEPPARDGRPAANSAARQHPATRPGPPPGTQVSYKNGKKRAHSAGISIRVEPVSGFS